MAQFIGYHIDGYDPDKTIPVATGITHEEAQAKAIRRVLSACVLNGEIGVQQRDDLSVEDFASVTKITDDFAAKHGLVS